MENKRKILIEFSMDWEDCEDIADELIIEDSGILDGIKAGVSHSIVKSDYALQAKCDRYETALKEVRQLTQKGYPIRVLICIDEALSAGKGEKPAKEIEYMPVHPEDVRRPGSPRRVPMHLLSEDQARSNHGQTLKRLKERGGLSVTEMLAIIQRRKWESMKWDDAIKMLNDILSKEEYNA